ncbi:MAG: SCE4755 family polysaccharide monooxygenase-like protein [Myxococcota bacterium]
MTRTVLVLLSVLAVPATASAHITLTYPTNRYGEQQKQGPCGVTGGERSQNVTVLEPGSTITLAWDETINHPSHYRISFDMDGDDDFADPVTMQQLYTNDSVMVDGLPDFDLGSHEYTITLPDVECDNCTLQLIQVMYDKPPYTIPGNDIYYNCADLVLQRGAGNAGADQPSDQGNDPEQPEQLTAGCSTGGGSGTSLLLGLIALGLFLRRR